MTEPAPVVLVTGASSGIGCEVALAYARRGANVVLAARSAGLLEERAAACRRAGAATATVLSTDVTRREEVDRAVERTVTTLGRIDVAVHTAGVAAFGDFVRVPAEVFEGVLTTNVVGSANLARAVLRTFRTQRRGTLVLTGSLLGKVTVPQMSAYVVSKHAVGALIRVLQQETRDLPDVRVCGSFPGSTGTPIYGRGANYSGRDVRPPFPVASAETQAARIVRLVDRGAAMEHGRLVDRLVAAGYHAVPQVFDLLVGPLMRVAMFTRRIEDKTGNVATPSESMPESE